jgi:pimeloyl-ACP methyl ester carboxylesterase
MVGLEFAPLRYRVGRAGFETRRFHYSSLLHGVDHNARRLGTYLQGIQAERLHLVAHSLGGLVTLRMFQQGVQLPPGRVVFLGSPIRGSRAAEYLTQKGLGWSIGKSGPGGLAEKYEPRWTEARELGVVAGTHEFAINPMNFGLVSPHDGMVSVSETHIEGAKESVTIHANHTGMLFTRELAGQVTLFLKTGVFRRVDT